jgi:hypothetical protein
MAESTQPRPFGRGFIAASMIVALILACAALLILTGPNSTAGPAPAVSTPACPTLRACSRTQPQLTRTSPATPTTCRPAGTDHLVPTNVPPPVDRWEVSRRVVVPLSTTYGPATTDPDGFRRCFAHSPTGALYAAYNAIAALADQRQSPATVSKLMLPSRDTDTLLRHLRTERPDDGDDTTQLAGYRFLDTSRDRATMLLALPVQNAYVSATLTLAWHADDWRVVPPRPGQPVGAPYAQLRDLAGFVPWSGV